MNLKPHQKGYFIKWLPEDHECVRMGYISGIVLGSDEKNARQNALRILSEHDISEDIFGNEFNYISVRLKRSPEHDRFLLSNGRIVTKQDLEYDKNVSERDAEFKKLLSDNPHGYAYIRKGGYYYKPDCCGYTEFEAYAGVYTLDFAVNQCLRTSLSDHMRPILIDIKQHNNMLNKQIESLKSRLIQA